MYMNLKLESDGSRLLTAEGFTRPLCPQNEAEGAEREEDEEGIPHPRGAPLGESSVKGITLQSRTMQARHEHR